LKVEIDIGMISLRAETKQILLRERLEYQIEKDFEWWFWRHYDLDKIRHQGKRYLRELLGDYCWGCGKRRDDLELHHKLPLSMGGPDELENYSLVCSECHARIHRGEIKLKKVVKLERVGGRT
jgi:5-methylcytosine-specific restriction endonuclease McrA